MRGTVRRGIWDGVFCAGTARFPFTRARPCPTFAQPGEPGMLPREVTMRIPLLTALLLTASNVFMTFAWYAHLKELNQRPWYVAALLSWGIALFEYLIQVPANRLGYTTLSLPQLKIMQEVIALAVFAPFCLFYMHQPLKLDYLWAALCLLGAVYFIFRS